MPAGGKGARPVAGVQGACVHLPFGKRQVFLLSYLHIPKGPELAQPTPRLLFGRSVKAPRDFELMEGRAK